MLYPVSLKMISTVKIPHPPPPPPPHKKKKKGKKENTYLREEKTAKKSMRMQYFVANSESIRELILCIMENNNGFSYQQHTGNHAMKYKFFIPIPILSSTISSQS